MYTTQNNNNNNKLKSYINSLNFKNNKVPFNKSTGKMKPKTINKG